MLKMGTLDAAVHLQSSRVSRSSTFVCSPLIPRRMSWLQSNEAKRLCIHTQIDLSENRTDIGTMA